MKSVVVCLVGLLVIQAQASQQPIISGQVRLSDGRPVAGAQVALFDLSDLRRGVVATTDEAGQFALPLAALSGHALPQGFALGANYPNPFNPATIIPYELAATSQVRLDVFNALGQRMATLVDGEQGAGVYQVRWDGTDESGRAVAAGVYLYRLTVASTSSADGASQTGRMVLVDGQAGVPMRGTSVEALPLADAEGAAYGLVVSGPGLVAYIDAEFRVKSGMEPVEIEVAAYPRARMKQTQRVLVMGDVDNNGRVDYADALLVMAYSLDPSVVMPNGGDIKLGDVNGDGVTDMADAQLILQQITDSPGPIVEPPEPAGLLAIPPLTLTVGSFYEHTVESERRFYNVSYSARSNSNVVEATPFPDFDYTTGSSDVPIRGGRVVITRKALGTAEVTIESPFGDAQTVSVTVVERPPSIDSVWPGEPKTEDITLVFYDPKGVLDPIEEIIPWFFLKGRFILGSIDLFLEYLGFGSTEIETKNVPITWVEYEHSQTTAYAVSKQPVSLYHATSGLLTEAFVTLQEAKKNVLQDIVLSLAPGWLMWPATAKSVAGDIQMYASMLDIVLAVERDESTKVELLGILAKDGSIIPGNSYLPFLMMKNDATNETAVFDLRLRVTQAIDIASADVAIGSHETIDFGPFTVPAKTGYQILSNHILTFTEEAGRDLTWVELELQTAGYDQNKEYRVRARGPSLAVEEAWASASMLDTARTEGAFEVEPNDQFTLWATVLNRSEKYPASSPTHLRYYCSSDPVIDPSDDFPLKDITKGEDFITLKEFPAVELARLDALGETQQGIRLPAPRARLETGDVFFGMCWGPNPALFKTIYYGACVWDEVEEEYNACSPGTPVQTGTLD